MTRRQRRNRARVLLGAEIALGLVTLVCAAYLIRAGVMYYTNNKEYADLAQEVVRMQPAQANAADNEAGDAPFDWRAMQIDFAALQAQNPDTIGWLAFDNGEIQYPIMWHGDNSYYLKHSASGSQNALGAIFLEMNNDPSLADARNIIYGHDTRNGSMFGGLRKYLDDDAYWQDSRYFTIYTPQEAQRYEIFSFHYTPEDSDVYTVGFTLGAPAFSAYAQGLYTQSAIATNAPPTGAEQIITLSTCSAREDVRRVVHAKRIA